MAKQTRRCRCLRCGGTFFTDHPTKKYCTAECRTSTRKVTR